jgi:hypothetical protein
MAGYGVCHTSAGPAQHVLKKIRIICDVVSLFSGPPTMPSAQPPPRPGGQVPLCPHPTNNRCTPAPNHHPMQAAYSRAPIRSPSYSQPAVAPRRI